MYFSPIICRESIDQTIIAAINRNYRPYEERKWKRKFFVAFERE